MFTAAGLKKKEQKRKQRTISLIKASLHKLQYTHTMEYQANFFQRGVYILHICNGKKKYSKL